MALTGRWRSSTKFICSSDFDPQGIWGGESDTDAVEDKTTRQDSIGPSALLVVYFTLCISPFASRRVLEFNADEPASSEFVGLGQDLRIADVEGKARDHFH